MSDSEETRRRMNRAGGVIRAGNKAITKRQGQRAIAKSQSRRDKTEEL